MDALMRRYPAGYVEIMGSVSVQLVYLAFGLVLEQLRPSYASETTPAMMAQSLRNHVVATLTHVAFVVAMGGQSMLTRTFIPPYSLPSAAEVVRDLAVGLLLRDAVFYAIHRLWHAPGVYKRVHAKHHEIRHPGRHHVLTISYMSVADFMFLYGFPVVGIAKLLEMNLATTLAFSFVSAVGEQVKLLWGDDAHDDHHLRLAPNYGVYGLMDALCGTTGPVARLVRKSRKE
ncbi:fatty acid hydroxylase superfamily protein [Colletotrichum graminicola]|uniref:Fatty acid hydroxylase superfamily protein n=1 Tax=Colletotrichum graminicola (strain M1.001 / M2 / FGSC 10212) TaxID=645133 RepID=E3QAX2_COLGM|nr:fatty acid hydroxylase superfamily protein [Colletotrichum graminicola M1.001]EFQ28010.1 fatty acid hydroxylase superfamily protein [Colletotrichum graminicola M1.001]WDK12036.1 fatty acid hydroxylase superfamily protein [Colletotrichum graminicola]